MTNPDTMNDAEALAVLDALHPVCPKPIRDYIAARLSEAQPAAAVESDGMLPESLCRMITVQSRSYDEEKKLSIDDVLRLLMPTPDVAGGAEEYGFMRGVEAARAAVKKALSAARGRG